MRGHTGVISRRMYTWTTERPFRFPVLVTSTSITLPTTRGGPYSKLVYDSPCPKEWRGSASASTYPPYSVSLWL